MKRGSTIVYCPGCGAPHLASQVRRLLGGWQLLCRVCGPIDWRARL